MTLNFNTRFWRWTILLLLALIWGSSFILMKKGIVAFSASQVAAMRLFFAFVFLLPVVIHSGLSGLPRYWKPILIVALIGNGIPAFLFTKGQTHIDSSLAGILNALVPLITLVAGIILFHTKVKWCNISGVLIGLAGAVALLVNDSGIASGNNIWYAALILLAIIFYGIAVNVIKGYLQELDSKRIAGYVFLFVGPPAGIYLLTTDFVHRLSTHNEAMMSLMYVVILGVVGTAMSVIAYNKLIKMTTALFAASVTYFFPVVAMIWGALDGEPVGMYHLVCVAVILLGVYLVNKKE